jgi:alpha-amylase
VKRSNDPELLKAWRKLTTSDHFYYMCTKWFNDGDVHKYFSPYDNPYDGFTSFMNVLNDIALRINNVDSTKKIKNYIPVGQPAAIILQ